MLTSILYSGQCVGLYRDILSKTNNWS